MSVRRKGRSDAFLRWLVMVFLRFLRSKSDEVFEDTEEEASHIKIFLEERGCSEAKSAEQRKGGANPPWLSSSHSVNPRVW